MLIGIDQLLADSPEAVALVDECVLRPARALANRFALAAVGVSVALQVTAMVLDPIARVLRVAPLELEDGAIVLGLAAVPAVAGQLWKLRRRP